MLELIEDIEPIRLAFLLILKLVFELIEQNFHWILRIVVKTEFALNKFYVQAREILMNFVRLYVLLA
jgi:hypothetical protein